MQAREPSRAILASNLLDLRGRSEQPDAQPVSP